MAKQTRRKVKRRKTTRGALETLAIVGIVAAAVVSLGGLGMYMTRSRSK